MSRQQRRAQERAKQKLAARVDAFRRVNPMGEAAYQAGFDAGFRAAAPFTFKAIYAAVCMALHDLHGFGHDRCAKVLMAVDDHVANTLTSTELIEEAWKKTGLYLNFEEPFDRIEDTRRKEK